MKRQNHSLVYLITLSLFSCTALSAMKDEDNYEISFSFNKPNVQKNEKEQTQNEGEIESLLKVLRQIDDEAYSGPFIVPEGALENNEPFELKTPHLGFEEKIKDTELQKNTLRSLGMDPTETNQHAYFSKPAELAQYLKQNLWGPDLLLEKISFQTPQEFVILDAVGKTQSLKVLSLKGSFLTSPAYIALTNALSRNKSLKILDLTGASCSFTHLTLLGCALSQQKSLRELRLNAKFDVPLTEDNIKQFYNIIQTNTGLNLIIWPGFKEEKKEEHFKKTTWLGFNNILEVIQNLSNSNRVAALHRGMMFKLGIGEEKDLNYALDHLKCAHNLGHPQAAYEIVKLYEKETKNFPKAIKWLNKTTEQGNMMAFVKRGDYFRKTWPKQQDTKEIIPDYKQAFENYKMAAEAGHRRALYKLGKMYESGRHVEKDLDKAAGFFFQACQRGCPDAYTALGALYKDPQYSQYDIETAKYYLRWGQYHPKSRPTATKLLSYIEQEEQKKKEVRRHEKENN